jgi:hypothetical protein
MSSASVRPLSMRVGKPSSARVVACPDRGTATDDAAGAARSLLSASREGGIRGSGPAWITVRLSPECSVRRAAPPPVGSLDCSGRRRPGFTRQAVAVRVEIAFPRRGILAALGVNITVVERTRSPNARYHQGRGGHCDVCERHSSSHIFPRDCSPSRLDLSDFECAGFLAIRGSVDAHSDHSAEHAGDNVLGTL